MVVGLCGGAIGVVYRMCDVGSMVSREVDWCVGVGKRVLIAKKFGIYGQIPGNSHHITGQGGESPSAVGAGHQTR